MRNNGSKVVRLNAFTSEVLGMVEAESQIGSTTDAGNFPTLRLLATMLSRGYRPPTGRRTLTQTQVNYDSEGSGHAACRPPVGRDIDIAPGGTLETFREFELIHDLTDRERKSLAIRRMYRHYLTWVTEKPHHAPPHQHRPGRWPIPRSTSAPRSVSRW